MRWSEKNFEHVLNRTCNKKELAISLNQMNQHQRSLITGMMRHIHILCIENLICWKPNHSLRGSATLKF